jgi:hypothetical protein
VKNDPAPVAEVDDKPVVRVAKTKKRKRPAPPAWAFLFRSFGEVFGFPLTPVSVSVVTLVVAGSLWFLIAHGFIGKQKAECYAVDVFFQSGEEPPAEGGLNEETHSRKAFFAHQKETVVTRPNPQGKFLMVHFTIPAEVVDQKFGNKMMMARLENNDVQLECGGQLYRSIFLVEQFAKEGLSRPHVVLGKGALKEALEMPGGGDDNAGEKPSIEPGKPKIEAPDPEDEGGDLPPPIKVKDGTLAAEPHGGWKFRGHGGMEVTCRINGPPVNTLQILWDAQSTGWAAANWAPYPSQIRFAWEVWCLFPRPEDPKNLRLIVLKDPVAMAVSGVK